MGGSKNAKLTDQKTARAKGRLWNPSVPNRVPVPRRGYYDAERRIRCKSSALGLVLIVGHTSHGDCTQASSCHNPEAESLGRRNSVSGFP